MADLTGSTPQNTYKDLLQVPNSNLGLDATLRTIQSGNGVNSILQLSTTALNVLGDISLTGEINGTVTIDTANFNNNLSAADDTVQKALDTIDDIVVSGGANLGTANITATTLDITSDTGTDATVPAAVATTAAGLMTGADKAKLDGVEAGANNYVHPNHTGDVTSSGDGATTISADAVDNTKAANMPANTIKGNDTAGIADPKDLTTTELRTLINVEDGATANSADAFLLDRANHTGTQTLATISDSGALAALNTVGTTEIDNDAVTFAKIQNAIANDKLLGSGNTGAGADYVEITLGTNLSMSGTTLNAAGGTGEANTASNQGTAGIGVFDNKNGVDLEFRNIISLSGAFIVQLNAADKEIDLDLADGAVTLDKLQNATANNKLLGSGDTGAGVDYVELSIGAGLNMSGNTLSAPGEANTASNQGTGGVGVFDNKNGTDFEFRNIISDSSVIDVTLDAPNKEINLDIGDDSLGLNKLKNAIDSSKLLGSGDTGAGADYVELTLGTNLSMSGTTLNATSGGANLAVANITPTTLDITSDSGTDATVPAATITDAGLLTAADKVKLDNAAATNAVNAFTKQQYFSEFTLIDATNISWNLDDAQKATVTLAGNRTLDNPTNIQTGVYVLRIVQDGIGGHTLAYGNAYKFPGGVAPTLSTGAGAVDILTCTSDGANMYCVMQNDFS